MTQPRSDSETISDEVTIREKETDFRKLGVDEDDLERHHLKLRGRKLTAALAFVAGTGFTLFGYDQGVLSALLTTKQFVDVFPQTAGQDGNAPTLQSFLVAVYEVGCLFGALSNLYLGDRLGRRKTIVLGGIIMIIGAILQTTAFSYAHMIVARIVTGLGNGLNTSTVPSYHAECSSPEKRGMLILVEGSLITFGIMISYWIDFAFFWIGGSSAQWRVPIAFQMILALIMIVGIMFLPESPRWLVKHGRFAEALAVCSALEDRPVSDPSVQQTFLAIRETVLMEGVDVKMQKAIRERANAEGPEGLKRLHQELQDRKANGTGGRKGLFALLTSGGPSQNFRRTSLGIVVQCFQQISGINLITYYATILFERLGLDDVKSRILAACNGTEYFLASIVAIFVIERIGRRKLMLWAAAGQCVTMILLAILGKLGDDGNKHAQIGSIVFLFVFNSIFATGWLGMTWLYPAEIVGLQIRAPANALSTASNWAFNFMVVMVTQPAFQSIGYRTYIVFAALNAFILPVVYLFFPETAGRSLEDMDVIFALAYKEGVSPVKVSFRKDLPKAGSSEADAILGFAESDDKTPDAEPVLGESKNHQKEDSARL